jgi:hypothetical protein
MASEKITKHEQSLLESLRYAAHGIIAPFACSGSLVLKRPIAVCFPDKIEITVSRAKGSYEQVQLLNPLTARCRPPSFGKGRKNLPTLCMLSAVSASAFPSLCERGQAACLKAVSEKTKRSKD